MELSDERLDELEALLEKATPGEWTIVSLSMEDGSLSVGRADDRFLVASFHNGASINDVLLSRFPEAQHANADLSCALRNAAPVLLAAARREKRLREALMKLHESKAMNAWGHHIVNEAIKGN